MARLHLFEFNDLEACPRFVRDSVVEILGHGLRALRLGSIIGPSFQAFAGQARAERILDLASGTGTPAGLLCDWLGEQSPHFLLSDLFPNTPALTEEVSRHPEYLVAAPEPVDATKVPSALPHDARTIINAFHHFPPKIARAILSDAVAQRKAVYIYEGFPRNLLRLLPTMPSMGPCVWLNPMRARGDRILKALFTYLLPIIPLVSLWDGCVSVMRVYTRDELLQLCAGLGDDFAWNYAEIPYGMGGRGVMFSGIEGEVGIAPADASPPGAPRSEAAPRPLPLPHGLTLLNAMRASRSPESFFARCEARDGDLFCVKLPGVGPLYLTGHPEGAQEIFKAPRDLFEPVRPNPIEPLLGGGSLILLAGKRHHRERKLLAPAFHGERMRTYGELMASLARDALRELAPGQVFDARALTQSLTLLVIIRAIFGVVDPQRIEAVRQAIEATTARYGSMLALVPAARFRLWGLSPWDRFRAAADRLDTILRDEIATRAGEASGEDILSRLLQLRYEDGQAMAEDDLLDELRTMLVAGHETAATGLAWALGYVHQDARIRQLLVTELGSDAPLEGLRYLEAVCKESLRRHPVVPIVLRKVLRPFLFRGAEIPPGVGVGIALTQLHTRPEVWDQPRAFYPEHFLERSYTPFEYAPFGGGVRRCVGAAFAGFEMRTLLGTLLREGSFASAGPLPAPVMHSITMSPGGPIRLRYLGGFAAES